MELQAVRQQLDAALKSPVAVAERPEHGGGVRARGHGVRGLGTRLRDIGSGRVLRASAGQDVVHRVDQHAAR